MHDMLGHCIIGSPGAAPAMASRLLHTWSSVPTCDSRSKFRFGWLNVWFATAWPASATAFAAAGSCSTFLADHEERRLDVVPVQDRPQLCRIWNARAVIERERHGVSIHAVVPVDDPRAVGGLICGARDSVREPHVDIERFHHVHDDQGREPSLLGSRRHGRSPITRCPRRRSPWPACPWRPPC